MSNSGKWKPVKLEGVFSNTDFEGLVGIEELIEYNFDGNSHLEKTDEQPNQNIAKKRKQNHELPETAQPRNKKATKKNNVKQPRADISPGKYVLSAKVESEAKVSEKKKHKLPKTKNEVGTKETETKLTRDDVVPWLNLGLPDEIIEGLRCQGFQAPTEIQALTIPPAIFGRRDILGAAETGSGKTLAFGLPILTGILDLKKNNVDINKLNEDESDSSMEDHAFDAGFDENFDTDEASDVDDNDTDKSENSVDENNILLIESESDEDEESVGGINLDNDAAENFLEDSSDELEWDSESDSKSDESNKFKRVQVDRFNDIKSLPTKPLYALILTPTRELAVQIKNHLIAAAKYTGIRVAVVLGGMASVKQERILSKSPEIVVATPGRLWELIQQGNPHLSQVDKIRYLVIDETDRMIERGHFQELQHLLERLNANEERRKLRQNFVFSATLTLIHDIPKHLLLKRGRRKGIAKLTPGQKLKNVIEMLGISDPKVIDVTKVTGTAQNLTECRITCPFEDKDYYLYYFLKRHPGRTLVFSNSIGCVKRLTTLFTLLQCNPLPLHASMQQRQRLKNLERFRDDAGGILMATDVAARGLDIPQVQHVIHYQVPRTAENYVHRSGRTARAMAEGIAVLFMEPSELKNYIRLCKTLGRSQDLPLFPIADSMLHAVKQRVNLARDLDTLELHIRRSNAATGWLQKAVDEMDIIVDSNEMSTQMMDNETSSHQKRDANIKRKQLNSLLAKPIFPKGFSTKYPSSTDQLHMPLVQGVQKSLNAIAVMKDALVNYARSGSRIGTLTQRVKNKTTNIRENKILKQKNKDRKKKNKQSKRKMTEI